MCATRSLIMFHTSSAVSFGTDEFGQNKLINKPARPATAERMGPTKGTALVMTSAATSPPTIAPATEAPTEMPPAPPIFAALFASWYGGAPLPLRGLMRFGGFAGGFGGHPIGNPIATAGSPAITAAAKLM